MIKYLSENDKAWKQIASNICKGKLCKEDIEDMVHDMYIKLEGLDLSEQEKSKRRNKSFVNNVLVNMFKDRVKMKSRTKCNISIEEETSSLAVSYFMYGRYGVAVIDETPNQLETIIKAEESKELKIKLNKISNSQREVIHLRYHKELRYKEIAEDLNIKIDNVKSILRRGRLSLKAM